MTCAEFQRVLPFIIESGGNKEEEEHLRSCPVCSDLVADLKYIAEAAKLLVPLEEPNARVWSGIRNSLEREGLVERRRAPARAGRWGGWAPLAAAVAVVAVVAAVLILRPADSANVAGNSPGSDEPSLAAGPKMDPEDEQLLAEIEARSPVARQTYETNLRYVNAYITEARKTLDENPANEQAFQHLMQAYEQKAMLYEMAISRAQR